MGEQISITNQSTSTLDFHFFQDADFDLQGSPGGDTEALRGIDFKVHRREFVCVIGPSGCGKSTLIRILAGLEKASAGQVLLDGAPVTGPGRDRGMVFQGYSLFPWLTVKGNVMFGPRIAGSSRTIAEGHAREWLELVGLTKFADAYPHQLPAACASAWPSRAPWPTSPSSCWPTNRPPRSTPRTARRSCGSSSA